MATGVKEGSIIEGIMAMYIAMIFADPDNGEDMQKMKRNISKLRKETVLQENIKPRIGIKRLFPRDDDLGYDIAKGDSSVNPHMKSGQDYIVQHLTSMPQQYLLHV